MKPSPIQVEFFRPYPKVELHRHLEGSLRLETMLDIARAHHMTLPVSLNKLVQVQEGEPRTFQNFLNKFHTLRVFYRSPEVIQRVTREAIEDAARENIRYLELRFTPVALSRAERFPLHEVMDWVIESAQQAAQRFKVQIGLIASINRHESLELAEQVIWLAIERMKKGIVGIDLAGNEAEFPAQPFAPVLKEARQAGLHLTVHAGEWGGAQNVREAIETLGAERIGHGVRVLEDNYTLALARENGIVFEVCPTSNYQSGVVAPDQTHPLVRMIQAGLKVTLNTDDPSVSQITLSHEYALAHQLGLSEDQIKECILQAIQAAFLAPKERESLLRRFHTDLKR